VNAIITRRSQTEEKWPAVQFADGRIFIGDDHNGARQQAMAFYRRLGQRVHEAKEGFMTASGRFFYQLRVKFSQ